MLKNIRIIDTKLDRKGCHSREVIPIMIDREYEFHGKGAGPKK